MSDKDEGKIEQTPSGAETPKNTTITLIRTELSDVVEIGTPGKAGSLKLHFDAADVAGAMVRLKVAVQILTEARRLTAPPGGDGK